MLQHYTAKSGNVCRYEIIEREHRTGVNATWTAEPSEIDKQEFMLFFLGTVEDFFQDPPEKVM